MKRPGERVNDEARFLAGYDASAFPRPSVAIDVVLLTVIEGALRVVLVERADHPDKGRLALPGGFVGIDESLDDAAARVLDAKAGLHDEFVEQLYTFGEPRRDPRARVISVAYYALVAANRLAPALLRGPGRILRLAIGWSGESGGPVEVLDGTGASLPLAFDHSEIIGMAVKRLRGKILYAPLGLHMVPETFALYELQQVYEAILGRTFDKHAFALRVADRQGLVEPTGEIRRGGGPFRPPRLYRFAARD